MLMRILVSDFVSNWQNCYIHKGFYKDCTIKHSVQHVYRSMKNDLHILDCVDHFVVIFY